MATLVREPEAPATTPVVDGPETPVPPPEGAPAAFAQERRCDACGAAMAPGQDWCLECGTAAPGRIGGRPGWRAGATVVGVTLLLVAGAVAASVAALSGDANREAAKPPPPNATPVAQAPPATAPPQPGATTPGATTPGATTPGVTPPGTTPSVGPPTITSPPRIFPRGNTNSNTTPPAVNRTPTPSVGPPTITPSPGATTPTPTTPSQTTPSPSRPSGPQTIALGADALSLYDPYGNATDKGDPADADDNNGDTSWFVTSKNPSSMGVGLLVDLESPRGVRVLGLVTKTPGFRVEVYGADKELPADVLDTRWSHIRDRSRVDETAKDGTKAGDAMERIVLGGGTSKYRYILLWFTTPPDKGPTVRLTQVTLQA